ncbi:STAS/SEC14 domain-containing protein [Luteolibacter soli]|uniref:STAS/SEC14 domain-containing protein n=1 Tax=Luteolibacter soli TaxID=3135280 RepID=A0ABU9B0L4_9BACT
MIEHHFDESHAILHVQPKGSLEEADFEALAGEVDPFIADGGELAGLIVETPGFPGWSSVASMIAHLRFVRDHHRHIRKVAVVTDSPLGNLAEHVASHFVAAEIKPFPAGEVEAARLWILGDGE